MMSDRRLFVNLQIVFAFLEKVGDLSGYGCLVQV